MQTTSIRPPVKSQPFRPKRIRKKIRNSEIPWYHPTLSPEHGILFVLLGSFLTGAALAFDWSSDTTWACITAFLGLQAEHPLVVQIKKRRRLQPRYALWAVLYGSVALSLTVWLSLKHPVLWWIVGGRSQPLRSTFGRSFSVTRRRSPLKWSCLPPFAYPPYLSTVRRREP